VVALSVPVLAGTRVRLEPLTDDHAAGLVAAADENRDTYAFTSVPHGQAAVDVYLREIAAGTAAGETLAFAQVRVADGAVVGVTRYLSFRFGNRRRYPYAVEIGGTWLAASAQRTGINVEAKLLLLEFAFDEWEVGRVDFKTDARNQRSRTAIEAIGARFEAVLRNWQPSHAQGEDGLLRDTAMFAIVAAEWPEVRSRLAARLG
jgi:RimJ/RimL family protein N-acetyltransferase